MVRRLLETIPGGPMRDLVWSTLINCFGNGMTMAVATLYAVRVVHVTNEELGLGLTVSAALAIVVGIGVGHLADRIGSRQVMGFFIGAQGLLSFVYAATRSYWLFLVVISCLAVANQATINVRAALIADITNPETRVRERAYLRAVTNLGVGLGSLVAGVAIALDTPTSYSTVLVLDGLTFLAALWFVLKLPQVKRREQAAHVRSTDALRNWPYLTAALLTGICCLHYSLLTLAVPLWVVQQTHAPHWVIATAMTANTVMCVLFQVRMSKGSETPESAARVVRGSMVMVAVACIVYWSAHGRTPWVAALLIMLGALVHVVGELRQSAGTWGMGYGLTPHEAHGQYQAVWQSSFTISTLVGPPLIAGFVVTHGLLGWAVFAVVFLVTGALMPLAARTSLAYNERMSNALRPASG